MALVAGVYIAGVDSAESDRAWAHYSVLCSAACAAAAASIL